MSKEIPSNIDIYFLCMVHILRIILVVFMWIAPIVFSVFSVVSAFNYEWVNMVKYISITLVNYFCYPSVLRWFEKERLDFKKTVDIWSEHHEKLTGIK